MARLAGSGLPGPWLLRLREAFGTLAGYVEGALEGDADAAEHAFVEEFADERDAVGDAAWRAEFRQWVLWIGGPVAAGFVDCDESGAQGERGMAGEVGDGEHLVTQ